MSSRRRRHPGGTRPHLDGAGAAGEGRPGLMGRELPCARRCAGAGALVVTCAAGDALEGIAVAGLAIAGLAVARVAQGTGAGKRASRVGTRGSGDADVSMKALVHVCSPCKNACPEVDISKETSIATFVRVGLPRHCMIPDAAPPCNACMIMKGVSGPAHSGEGKGPCPSL